MDEYGVFIKELFSVSPVKELVELITDDPVYLVGGKVYRSLALARHGVGNPQGGDFDILVEGSFNMQCASSAWGGDWETEEDVLYDLSGVRFVHQKVDGLVVDVFSCVSVEEYFKGVPLDIQAIAYDIVNEKIWGEKGVAAIEKKVIHINNLENCLFSASKSGKTINEYIDEKNKGLGFKIVRY